MGSIVAILQGSEGERTVEGFAEIKEVVSYDGGGWYLIDCVFLDDLLQRVVRRLHNIDEELPNKDLRWVCDG